VKPSPTATDSRKRSTLSFPGAGRVKLDDELVELSPLDAVRVSPGVARSFEAGPDGLEVLIFGPHVDGDGETVADFWDSVP